MNHPLSRSLAVAAVGSSVLALTLVTVPSQAVTGRPSVSAASAASLPTRSAAASHTAETSDREPADIDVRQLTGKVLARREAASARSNTASARSSFVHRIGTLANVQIDPLTNTPRIVSNTDGFLTAASTSTPQTIVLRYLRAHLADLGLDEADLSTLVFRTGYADNHGTHYLSWSQQIDGTPVFGNGLKAAVTKDGRLVEITGSPVHDLADLVKSAPSFDMDAARARTTAAQDVGGKAAPSAVAARRTGAAASTTWKNSDFARKVWFLTAQGLRPGWSTYVQTGVSSAYQHVIDAATGQTLYRHDTVDKSSGDAYVYDYYPGAPRTLAGTKKVTQTVTKKVRVKRHGTWVKVTKKVKVKRTVDVFTTPGTAKVVNFFKKGWLPQGATVLDGTSVQTWADLPDDDNYLDGVQTPVPGNAKGATDKLVPFKDNGVDPTPGEDQSSYCSAAFVCTWDPQTADSWKTNMAADENNAFYLANTYHDYLASDKAIGFTVASGNFTTADGDPVLQQVMDGADTGTGDDAGMPDADHIDNANMNTPPDGTPPRMQMYLWHAPYTSDADDQYNPSSGAFDASILLHEYTHGLSNRLVVDADGNSTLNSLQAGSMGEAWSDYYAMDYLVTHHFQKDTRADGQVMEGQYVMGGAKADLDGDGSTEYTIPFRTMPMDCSVDSASEECFDSYNPAVSEDPEGDLLTGGYTYGAMPVIGGSPEVHSSGEVWSQTLWDIRKALGHTVADTVITDGMRLSAEDPSMLDMRNAILLAAKKDYGNDQAVADKYTKTLWRIFATRGMGFYAASTDSADTDVAQDFSLPPAPKTANYSQYITGTVTDGITGQPVAGAVVTVAGFGTTYQSQPTGADGKYSIAQSWGMYPGTYPKVVVTAPGYFATSQSVTVPVNDHVTSDFTFTGGYDWAASATGATVADFNGPDYTDFGCGPGGAIDTSFGTGWGSTSGDDDGDASGTFVPKHITVKLSQPIDAASFGVDPSATCGDPGSASTGDYQIEVSSDGSTWTTVSAPGARFDASERTGLTIVSPVTPASDVQYVRFTIEGNQVYDAAVQNDDPNVVTGDPDATFAKICGGTDAPNYGGCNFSDLTEFAVFGTPSS